MEAAVEEAAAVALELDAERARSNCSAKRTSEAAGGDGYELAAFAEWECAGVCGAELER
jgi:hypothetical protein